MDRNCYNSSTKEWLGQFKPCLYNPKTSVGTIIHQALIDNSDRVLSIHADTNKKTTGKELREKSVFVALNLQKLGINQGDIVCILSSFNEYLEALIFGCMFTLAPFACLDLNATEDELRDDFVLIQPKLIVCEKFKETFIKETLQKFNLSIPIITCGFLTKEIDGFSTFEPATTENFNTEKLPLFLIYTSGTSGKAKQAVISHAVITTQCLGSLKNLSNKDVVLNFKPFTWITSLFSMFNCIIRGCTRIVTNQAFSPEFQSKLIIEYKVTMVASTALEIAKFLEYEKFDLSSVKVISCTGTKLPMHLRRQLEKYSVTVLNIYGMTETGYLAINSNGNIPNAVGQPFDRIKLKIVNESCERLGPNEHGEVCVKLSTPFLGYYKNEKETLNLYDNEGWLHTGDIGFFDENGFLYIEGRIKSLLRIRNDKEVHFDETNATEVEELISKETGLHEVCVVGIDDSSLPFDLPAAAIVKGSHEITEEDIVKVILSKFTPNHIAGGVFFVDSLPMTVSMKFRRLEVKKMVEKIYFDKKVRFGNENQFYM